MCGFTKYFSVKLDKNDLGFFSFVSVTKETNEQAEDVYETDYFLRRFTNEYVRYLKSKYNKVVE